MCGWGVVVRAVSKQRVPLSSPFPHPPQLAANSAEAQNSALQSARSERNVIALSRESWARIPLRKGAAYWSLGAARFAGRRSQATPGCAPTRSCALVLNPKRVKPSLLHHPTLCGRGSRTHLALGVWTRARD